MSKMSYLNNTFSKIAERWRLCSSGAPLPSDFGDLKLRDLPKSGFSNGL